MRGRYSADDKTNDWMAEYCDLPSKGLFRVGDIRLGERTPVIIAGKSKPLIGPMTGGIQGNGGLIWLPSVERAQELLDMTGTPLRREHAVEQISLWEN